MKKDLTKAEKLLSTIGRVAVQTFERDGCVHPDLTVEDAEGHRVLVRFLTGFQSNDAKDETAKMMRRVVREHEAVRYAMVMEAWMVDGSRGDDEKGAMDMIHQGKSLAAHPDRREVVTVFVEDRNTKERLIRNYYILRPEHGDPTLSPPRDLTDLASSSGRFMSLFEEAE